MGSDSSKLGWKQSGPTLFWMTTPPRSNWLYLPLEFSLHPSDFLTWLVKNGGFFHYWNRLGVSFFWGNHLSLYYSCESGADLKGMFLAFMGLFECQRKKKDCLSFEILAWVNDMTWTNYYQIHDPLTSSSTIDYPFFIWRGCESSLAVGMCGSLSKRCISTAFYLITRCFVVSEAARERGRWNMASNYSYEVPFISL